jgi:hypothetical protein
LTGHHILGVDYSVKIAFDLRGASVSFSVVRRGMQTGWSVWRLMSIMKNLFQSFVMMCVHCTKGMKMKVVFFTSVTLLMQHHVFRPAQNSLSSFS